MMPDAPVHSLLNLESGTYDKVLDNFEWPVPEKLNIAQLTCTRHADGSNKLALVAENESGACEHYTFDELERLANQLANAFRQLGVGRGDRVAVILPQRVETALVHLAAQKLGAISLPLSVLFGEDALRYRLADSGSCIVVTTTDKTSALESLLSSLPGLQHLLVIDTAVPVPASAGISVRRFWDELRGADDAAVHTDTAWDDPAFLLYTSGTTGPPKGALIPQRAMIGNLTGFEASQNGFPQAGDCMYTPADWAWTGGLLDALLPAWYYGVPVVGYDYRKFNAEAVASLMSRHKVTCAFIPPTALKMMRAVPDLFERHPSHLRSIMSAGEAVGEELFAWGRSTLGFDINEMCGQTEHNYIIGNCSAAMPVRPGSMGKAYPGHTVVIMGEDGTLLDDDQVGEIVVDCNDPVHFLGYWKNAEATARKYTGTWFHTGDVGYRDKDGYLWFMGRADDVISSAGYRIGPGEIEDCVLKHPAILQVAAIGVPDPEAVRGDIVKLCIVLRDGHTANDELEEEIRAQVRDNLAAYEYPRAMEFFDALPMTTTGKVKRKDLRQMHLDRS